MTIAIITPWFSENMGYAENKLPKELAKLGCEVHLISSDFQIYATSPEIYKIYEPFLGPPIVATGVKYLDGYTLHRIEHYKTKYGIGLKGLQEKFNEIKPQIVYLFEINTEQTLQVVGFKHLFQYKVFTESRLHLSVYKPPSTLKKKLRHYFGERLKWREVGKSFELCYAVAPDVLHVICRYFGQDKKKCKLSSLAVDTDIFRPISSLAEKLQRDKLRAELGFNDNDIVCLYTGRFTDDKGTLLLAKAIDVLQQQGSKRFKGLFVGTGDGSYETNIANCAGCVIHPFVKSSELVAFYQSADVGVWPKQESTSQLDAIACGLPLIVSSNVEDIDRIKGSGISYDHENVVDLANKIKSLEESKIRQQFGLEGVKKVKEKYSWEFVAQSRLGDFRKVTSK